MISAVTLRRVGQLNAENQTLRNRMADLKSERDYLLRRLADCRNVMDVCHDQKTEDTTFHVHHYFVRMD